MTRHALLVTALLLACDSPRAPAPAKTATPAAEPVATPPKTPAAPATLPAAARVTAAAPTDGPVTVSTLVGFLPERMRDAPATNRQAVDDALAAASYRTPEGFININLALVRDVDFARAQVRGAEDDAVVENPGARFSKRGVAVGSHRALVVTYASGNKTEIEMLLRDRIELRVSTERTETPEAMVALVQAIDLDGLVALAERVPAP